MPFFIQTLKHHGPLHDAALLTAMQVGTADIELRRAIGMQLEALGEHGRVKKGAKGWKWIG